MAKKILGISRFNGGVSDEEKRGVDGSFFFSSNIDIYKDPSQISLFPAPSKVSGSTVTSLVKWAESGAPYDTNKYFYDENGKIYRETSGGTWSVLRSVANSGGQGLAVVNDYLYYTQDTQIGRYGPLSGSPTFTDDWQTGLNDTSDTDFAPIKAFGAGFVVGHGNDLAFWDGSTWDDNAVVIPPDLNIRAIEILDEYIVMGTWRGTSITDNEEGFAFFWDGTASTFNFFVSIPEGGINALLNNQNRIFSFVGSSGVIYVNHDPFLKIQQLPKIEFEDDVEIYPGAMTNWQNFAVFGVAGGTTSTTMNQGVYVWGARSSRYQEVLSYAFGISTGTKTGAALKIGSVKGMGNDLYIGWKDGANYGVDKISNTDNPASSGEYESLIHDDNRSYDGKRADVIKATHKALRTGESVRLSYKINRASSYTNGDINSTVGSTDTRLPLSGKYNELQVKITLAQTNDTSPTVTSLSWKFDDLKEEEEY